MSVFDQLAARLSETTPGDLACRIDPTTVQTEALRLIDESLVWAANTPRARLIISVPPQEGKSTRAARTFPIWVLRRNPGCRIIIASAVADLARKHGRWIRNRIVENPWLGIEPAYGNSAVDDWTLEGNQGGVKAVGVGGAINGNPADLLIIDDPVKDRADADSLHMREMLWDWWLDNARTRLAPTASVVVIMTRWHEDDFTGRLTAAPDGGIWRILNIPAQADHDPARGQTDPLGREPGQYLVSARGRTVEEWEAIKAGQGARGWNALYQGHPAPTEGGILKRHLWQEYTQPLWLEDNGVRRAVGFDQVLASWDMTFKDTQGSDYVVGQVWGRRGAQVFLLDQVRGRWDFPETCRQVRQLAARWPDALLKLVEDKANGPAVLAQLRATVPGLVAEQVTEGKIARANAVSPIQEGRQAFLPSPELAPWVGDFIEEAAAFPNGRHDDQVDAFSQALKRLIVTPLLASGAIYGEWDPARHTFDTLPRNIRWLSAGVEYSTTNPTRGVLLGLADGVLYVTEEWAPDPAPEPVMARQLAGWLGKVPVPWVVVTPKASGFRAQLFNDGMSKTIAAADHLLPGIRLVAGLIGAGRLRVHTSCTHLLRELPGYMWDPQAAAKGDDAPLRRDDHSLDALRFAVYATRDVWRQHTNIPTSERAA